MFRNKEEFIKSYKETFDNHFSKSFEQCTKHEQYEVLVELLQSKISIQKADSKKKSAEKTSKKIYYFSMEFLIGKLLKNYVLNLGLTDIIEDGLLELGTKLDDLAECERDPGLGNGGLGRLAACFIDSMAFLGIEGHGTGLRYRFGLFEQKIVNGEQVEIPDNWTINGYPWEHRKSESAVTVKFGGKIEWEQIDGEWIYKHVSEDEVRAIPYDVPIVGYGGETVNNLRLWSAEPLDEKFDLDAFTRGEYSNALRHKSNCEAITQILYPNDSTEAGKILRLKQEYLLVSAGVTTILRDYKKRYGKSLHMIPERISIHINDTHPAMCIPELMRLLLDEEDLEWDAAWTITTKTISYTNHTILPEALEKWSICLFRSVLPRLYMIIEEIDRRYKEKFNKNIKNWADIIKNTSVLWDGQVKMANLSVIGSHSVNGVAALHTDLLKNGILKDFYNLYPEKFNNKTNGISHRRFLMEANPELSELITAYIGDNWQTNPMHLKELEKFRNDEEFLEKLQIVRKINKCKLAGYIKKTSNIDIDPDSIFDVHVKRIHAYKRQLLNIFKVIALYNDLKSGKISDLTPSTFIFGGKAAQSYVFAKDVIKLINTVAEIVNSDEEVNSIIKVVFIENLNVSNGQIIYAATDISEQISTAGYEASGTGNMKFMFNGALTLGTLDGANVEISEMAGDDNAFIFGLTAQEVIDLKASSSYLAYSQCESNPSLKKITEQLLTGFNGKTISFTGILDDLMHSNDHFLVLKDFDSYMNAWYEMNKLYKNYNSWFEKSLVNIANSGFFTSDRTIAEYADSIWNVEHKEIN